MRRLYRRLRRTNRGLTTCPLTLYATKAEEQRFTCGLMLAKPLQDGGVILRRWRKHWYIRLDRSWRSGGFTSVRTGYGGLIETLADAKARFLPMNPLRTNRRLTTWTISDACRMPISAPSINWATGTVPHHVSRA